MNKKQLLLLLAVVILGACNRAKQEKEDVKVAPETWIPLFNGENLEGWTAKIAGYPVGENFGNTFRVEDGILTVNYDAYDDGFQSRYGHLFTNSAYSHYKLRVEYRFRGKGISGAPGWAYLNNGIMFHAQPAESMILDQWFPLSIEAQVLANDEQASGRTTGNVCTPGTSIYYENEPYGGHCLNSSSASYPAEEWVTLELEVYGDSLARHIVNGDTVLTYTRLTADKQGIGTTSGRDISGEIPVEAGPLSAGHIAIQAEGHATEFRKIEILDLSQK